VGLCKHSNECDAEVGLCEHSNDITCLWVYKYSTVWDMVIGVCECNSV
jgi:hypothetical protein